MKTHLDVSELGRVCLHKMGHGPQAIIALHGFSRTGSIFTPLAHLLEKTHTFYALDLPFHGATNWQANSYSPEDIAKVILTSVEAKNISSAKLLGHSLGGRIWLKTIGQGLLPPTIINELILVAPDGLRGHYTGKLDKIPSGLVKALAWAGGRRDALLKLANFLHQRRLFDKYTLNYLKHHLRDERTQQMLLGSFRSLPAFRLGKTEQKGLEQLQRITTLVGTQDPLMNFAAVQRWFQPLQNASTRHYNGHHSLPVSELAQLMASE